jgi:ribonuclease HII
MNDKILGIDEAGRGPVIGSMFIGGFLIDEDRLKDLESIGVKDSKKLSNRKRESLREKLDDLGEVFLIEFTASKLDDLMDVMTINEVELKGFAEVIDRAEPDKVFMDLPEPEGDRFIGKVKDLMNTRSDLVFTAEHGADDEYPVVSAASIVAKSARESNVEELHEKYGYDFASGYPHDKPTREFLEKYVEEKGELPPEARKSWSTSQDILEEAGQENLKDF